MEEAVASGRGRWSTAIGLTLAVVLLSVFDAMALVLLPLAILMVGLPAESRLKWTAAGVALWVVAMILASGGLTGVSRGWALAVGASFLGVTLIRPAWGVTSRALIAIAISLADLRSATEQISGLQGDLFPALLALQSLLALALASWWIRWTGRSESPAFELHRLRDFRFNDQMIWLLIVGLILLLVPLGTVGDRIAINAILFMVALYAFRGLAIFVFLATGTRSIPTMVLGAIALVLLYPVAFTAALLMGLGDTWLDVRRRVVEANPT